MAKSRRNFPTGLLAFLVAVLFVILMLSKAYSNYQHFLQKG